ncbi:hypothetical protein [Aeromonas veronii]|uniref:hypothetical protein n=1 Tax=Aeromonas veronii TaxID=654 RepID=UPI0007B593E8|nr:hypothetical protein A6033_02515 [Aeromonas veronii]
MQLDEFVKTSIVQIAKGVKDAQEEVRAFGGAVNPSQYSIGGYSKPDKEKIEFDVALVVQDSTSSEVGGKLSVASMFGMSGKHSGNDSYQQTSRVKFNVHVDLPYTGKID